MKETYEEQSADVMSCDTRWNALEVCLVKLM